MKADAPTVASKSDGGGAWAPFRSTPFALLWGATVVSNVGTWTHDVGAGWLMTSLAPSPVMVSLVQAATTLPVFLFALVAGAVADVVDRRKLLIVVNLAMGMCAALFAGIVLAGWESVELLLLFTFLLGAGAAFVAHRPGRRSSRAWCRRRIWRRPWRSIPWASISAAPSARRWPAC